MLRTLKTIGSLDVELTAIEKVKEHYSLSARGDTNDADYIYSAEEFSCLDELTYMTLCFLNKYGSINHDFYDFYGNLREEVKKFSWLLKPFKSGLVSPYLSNSTPIPIFSLVNDGEMFQFYFDDEYYETPRAHHIDDIELKYFDSIGISYAVSLTLNWDDPKIMERFFLLTLKDLISSDKIKNLEGEQLTVELGYINSIRPEGCKVITKEDLIKNE